MKRFFAYLLALGVIAAVVAVFVLDFPAPTQTIEQPATIDVDAALNDGS